MASAEDRRGATDTRELEARFDQAMAEICRRALREAGYKATILAALLAERGGLATARFLLGRDEVSDGYTNLWQLHRLDLTVEAYVLRPEFLPLFTSAELDTARARLKEYGYKFPPPLSE